MKRFFVWLICGLTVSAVVGYFGYDYYIRHFYESGLKIALREVNSDFGLEVFWPPQSGDHVGKNFRPEDKVILYKDCLLGDIEVNSIAESVVKKFQYSDLGNLGLDIDSIIKGDSKIDRSVKAELRLRDLYSKNITNLAPTFNESCAPVDFFPKDPVFVYVLYAKDFTVVLDLLGADSHELIQDADSIGGRDLRFDVEIESGASAQLKLVAKDIAIGYLKAKPEFSSVPKSFECKKLTSCSDPESGYRFSIQDVQASQVSLILNNELFGQDNQRYSLRSGETVDVFRAPAARHTLEVNEIDSDKDLVKLKLYLVRWKFERGERKFVSTDTSTSEEAND